MIPETRFEQAHGVTAGKLSYALELMDKGDVVCLLYTSPSPRD